MRSCRLVVTLALIVSLWTAADSLACPSEPSDSWVYPYLYELRLREPAGGLFLSTGPYDRLQIADWLKSLQPDEQGPRSTWLYGMLEAEFADEAGVLEAGSGWTGGMQLESRAVTDSNVTGEALAGFSYYSPLGLCFWTSIRTSVNSEAVHKVETRAWRTRGRSSVDYAGFGFRKNGFLISFARDEVSWGANRRRGLLFSGSAPVFDMLRIAYRTERLSFTSLHTRLRPGRDEEWGDEVRRFVAAHRLEVLPTERLSLSVSEAVIYGGPWRDFEPVYLNPMGIFYAAQWNSERNDNILIAGDFALLFPQGVEIRGEVMFDDFQYDFDTEPHEFGAGLEVTSVNPLRPETSLMGASYYHVRNQTYGHFLPWNRFVHEGGVMGYPDGPDGDRLALWLTFVTPQSISWRIDYSFRRQGEGRAVDIQEEKGPRLKFPSGVVESEHAAGLGVCWRPSLRWLVRAEARYSRVCNRGHRENADEDGWDLAFSTQFDLKLKTWIEN
jgi:hypothetical protein